MKKSLLAEPGKVEALVFSDRPLAVAIEPTLLTVDQVALITNIGRSKLYKEMDAKRLRFIQYGSTRRLTPAMVRDFVRLLDAERTSVPDEAGAIVEPAL
jgi:excisionase family DNA binding protein